MATSLDVSHTTAVPAAPSRIGGPRGGILEQQEEVELVLRYRATGDRRALARLVEACLPRVEAVAYRYRHYPVERCDLVGEGHVGLITAIDRFDPRRGVRLVTYATYWIRAYMVKYVASSWGYGKTGMGVTRTKVFFKIRRERARAESMRMDEDELLGSLCETFDLSPRSVRRLLAALDVREYSMEARAEASGRSEVGYDLPSGDEGPEERISELERRELFTGLVTEALATLDERQRFVVTQRYCTEPAPTFAELGRRLGLSRERVRQIESAALERMARHVGRSGFTRADLATALG
jgi:RNA polymerase sigma-32 factor